MILGYDAPSLPHFLLPHFLTTRRIATRHIALLATRTIPLLRRMETLIRPRLSERPSLIDLERTADYWPSMS
jgi:hypothetical protein